MKKSIYISLFIIILAFVVIMIRINKLSESQMDLKDANVQNTSSIESIVTNRSEVQEFENKIDQRISSSIDSISQKELTFFKSRIFILRLMESSIYENKLDSLNESISKLEIKAGNLESKINQKKEQLTLLEKNKERAKKGLPQLVSLDELGNKYLKRKKNNTTNNFFSSIVSFETTKGTISFKSREVDVVQIPNTNKTAWVRIGKSKSKYDSSIIKAWLEESVSAKKKQGYRLISNRTYEADYGEYTVKNYRKGDMYFKTYYRYIRNQGTYDSTFFTYTFYVETGSVDRKEEFSLRQYNDKTGS